MAKYANSPNFLWKIENFNSNDKLVLPGLFLGGLKWQLLFSHFKDNDTKKVQLVLHCLSAPEESSTWQYTVKVDIVNTDGNRKELKSGNYSLKEKDWWIWSDSIKNFQYNHGQKNDCTFLVIVIPTGNTESLLNNQKTVENSYASPCVESLTKDFGKLLQKEEHSDFVLKCGSSKFHVHKAVLCARSDFFNGMFRIDMREKNEGEAKIENIDPAILLLVLRYLYTGEIPSLSLEDIRKVYSAADRLCVESLKLKCYSLFTDNLTSTPEKHADNDSDISELTLDFPDTSESELRESEEKKLLRNLFMSREWRLFSQEFKYEAQEMCRPYLLTK